MAPLNHPLAGHQRRFGGTGGGTGNGSAISPGVIAGVIAVLIIFAILILIFIMRAQRSRTFREEQATPYTYAIPETGGTNAYIYNEPVTGGEDGISGAGVSRNWMGQINYKTDPATGLKIPQPSLSRVQGWEGEMTELRGQVQKDSYSNQVGRGVLK